MLFLINKIHRNFFIINKVLLKKIRDITYTI